jgi:thiamine-phosphate pyrophosphorylase
MFIIKNKYYLIIESIKDIDLKKIKSFNKYIIIYRNYKKIENIDKLRTFREKCKAKKVEFFIANNVNLLIKLKVDGLYISAHNKNLSLNRLKNTKYKLIGSAHNIKEINLKKKQGCSEILFSRLFKTSYKNKESFLGIVGFNLFKISTKENLVPLGGINSSNLNKLNIVKCDSIALLSEVKKKPAIFSRLF